MSEDKPASVPLQPKYSRYRSVRQQAEAFKSPPPVPQEKSEDAPVSRSMSRYRRPKTMVPSSDAATPPMPAIASGARGHEGGASMGAARQDARVGKSELLGNERSAGRQAEVSLMSTQRAPENERYARRQAPKPRETEVERLQHKGREQLRDQGEQKRRAEKEQAAENRRREEQAVSQEAERARVAEELLAKQKRKDLERLEAELDAATPAPARVTSPKDKFTFFGRKRAATRVTPPGTVAGGSRSSEESRAKSRGAEQAGGNSAPILESRKKSQDPPRAIEAGGGGVVPGTDAPKSAVNAGERRVLIRYKQSSINLPVTPETTPLDLIYSAANIMNQAIVPSTAILLESYTQLGLERRIRRYEHIRDIMNSWDRDTQNALILQNSDTPKHDLDLAASAVPRDAPKSVSIYLYHSQKPGKWNKRYITLLSSGQIYVAKKLAAKPSDKDVVNICHLSDFDIYTPTAQQLRKYLKPPKRYCHAIKSQQKTTMFLSTENFVHFFSTDDDTLAKQWYDAVQEWRSWYLVNRKGDTEKPQGQTMAVLKAPMQKDTKGGPTHKVKVSVDGNPYTIGSFRPLMDMDRFGQAEPDLDDEDKPRQIPFHLRDVSPQPPQTRRERHPPPVSYRLPPEAEEEFASSGLLGRTYSQKQRQQRERETAGAPLPAHQPFIDGPSLLNGPTAPPTRTHHRNSSVASTKRPETSAGPDIQRSSSKREKPKPLLDFTPQFKEAPQWDKTGKGKGIEAPTGVPLVDVATTPDNPLADIPKATLLRREVTTKRPQTSAARAEGEGAFIKGGLVSGF